MLTREDQALLELIGKDSPEAKALLAAASSPGMEQAVHEMLRSLVRQRGLNPDDPPRFALPHGITLSDFLIGSALCGDVIGPEVGPSEADLPCHVGVFGMTNVGKTTLIKLLLLAFTRKAVPEPGRKRRALVLDLHSEYKDLMRFFGPGEIVWLNADELGLNPFAIPEGADGKPVMAPDKWLNNIRELMRLLWLNEPSLNMLCAVLRGLYEDRGVFEGSRNYPSLTDLIEALKRLSLSRATDAAKARDKLLDRLESLRAMLPGLDVAQSRSFRRLMDRSVILDLADVKDVALPFLFSLVTTLLREVFWQEGDAGTWLMLVMEEAHALLGGQTDRRTSDLRESKPSGVLRDLRKTGTCGVVVSQLLSDLVPSILGNLGTVISLRQGHRQCVRLAAAALNLSPLQEQEIAKLPNRRAVARFSRFADAMLLEVKDARTLGLGVSPPPSREEARERSRAVLEAIPYGKVCEPPRRVESERVGEQGSASAPEGGLPPVERKVFARISERPWELIGDRMDALGLDREGEGEARVKLEARGLIAFAGTVGAKHRLFEPTARGREYARELGLAAAKPHKGSVPHQAIVQYLERALGRFSPSFRFLRTGVSSTTAGVQPDLLLVTGGGQRIPIQACCHNQPAAEADALLRLHRLAQLGPGDADRVDFLIAVAANKRHKAAVERALRARSGGEMPGRMVLLDFDSVTGPSFDWVSIFEFPV